MDGDGCLRSTRFRRRCERHINSIRVARAVARYELIMVGSVEAEGRQSEGHVAAAGAAAN